MATGGRKTQLPLIHEISLQSMPSFGGAVLGASGIMGVLPAGAVLGVLHVAVGVAFNSTTNSLILGTTPGGNQILAATDLKAVARTDTAMPIAVAGPFGSDTPIYFTYTQTGPVPTAGAMAIWLDYLAGPDFAAPMTVKAPGRKTQYQATHEISVQFGFGQTAGVVGVLPAGAVLDTTHLVVSQAWNSTTNTLAIGTTPGGAQLLAATDLKTLGRTDTVAPVAAAGPFAVDTPIYATAAFTGGAPNLGVATVWLDYLPGAG